MANKLSDNFLCKCQNQMAISKFYKYFVLSWKYEVEIWTNYAILFQNLISRDVEEISKFRLVFCIKLNG